MLVSSEKGLGMIGLTLEILLLSLSYFLIKRLELYMCFRGYECVDC